MRIVLPASWLAALVAGCVSPYLDTTAPKDATFQLQCELPAAEATAGRLRVDVAFATVARHYSFGCEHRAELRARLQTIADLWCDGLPVAPKTIGPLTVATTTSELTGKRAATIDDGQGYVSFQCGEWLPQLIAGLGSTSCCAPSASPSPPTPTGALAPTPPVPAPTEPF